MALNFLKHRWQKTLLISVASLLLIIGIGALFINKIAEPILSNKLKEGILKGTDSLYSINFSDADVSILQGRVKLYDVSLNADKTVLDQLKKQGKLPERVYALKVKSLDISGLTFVKFYLHKELGVGEITVKDPSVVLSRYANKKDASPKDDRPLYDKIKKDIQSLHVDKIKLVNGNYTIHNYTQAKPTKSVLNRVNVEASNLLIDSTTRNDTTRVLFCKDIDLSLRNYFARSATGLYTYKVRSARLSIRKSQLDIAGIDLIPVAYPTFFAKSKGDRFTLHLDSVKLANFDYQSYRDDKSLLAGKLTLYKGYFEVMSNYNGQVQATNRIVTFPHWALQNQIKDAINIDTLVIKNLDVAYKERGGTSLKMGVVKFDNTSGRILNITNNKKLISQNNNCAASLTTYFMGKGRLNINFNFRLGDPLFGYNFKGHLAPLDMAVANPATIPLSMVRIVQGRVKSLDFAITGNKDISTGKVNFLYNNLKVDVLRKDDEKGYTKRSILSFLAGSLVIKENNPDNPGETPREAKVILKRPWNYPFFKTVWLSVLNGIKPIAGAGDTKEDLKLNKNLSEKDRKKKEKELKRAEEKKKEEEEKQREKLKEKKS
ncbi:hypothetical protein FPZ43_05985 [Mucilaginibacter pallidiroseus]|uniref:Uncharacterized protein n=1 Tax=Mucilaginibacter pallidiroseus TaxID=2599295 RepID=A0A563UGS9_9SPHI|nr:hypothetical protein [Mucilaginibacter pallidiroseus]TWR30488.1 hypothetical protein FPZ43_05985 [Mucilaginibacter pallidiroseus]